MEKLNLLNYKKIEFTKLNDQFTLAKCYVMALGKNKNRTHFSKENVDKAYSSLNFIPVVAHVLSDDNGNYYLGGHDIKLDLTDGFKLKNLCIPYGVAIPSQEPVYEDVTESDGSVVTYLTTNVVLWTGRYPELESTFYNEEIFSGQSMEILYSKAQPLEEDKDYMDIIDFSFDALCMLGKSDDSRFNVEPCFPNAKIESLFSLDRQVFDKFKEDLIEQFGSLEELRFQKEGGEDMDELRQVLSEFNLTEEELDFEIKDLSVDELREKLKEFTDSKSEESAVVEDDQEPEIQLEQSKFTTYKEKREIISGLFKSTIDRDALGKVTKEVYYYLMDFDDKYAYVSIDTWENETYKEEFYRYPYKMNDNQTEAVLDGDREKLYRIWVTEAEKQLVEDSKQEFEAYKEAHSHTNEEYDLLSQYKASKEKEEFNFKIDEIVSTYEDISDKNEFKELYKNRDNYSLQSFEKECIYIRGLYASVPKKKKNFSAPAPTILKFGLDDNDTNDKSDVGKFDYLKDKYLSK